MIESHSLDLNLRIDFIIKNDSNRKINYRKWYQQ